MKLDAILEPFGEAVARVKVTGRAAASSMQPTMAEHNAMMAIFATAYLETCATAGMTIAEALQRIAIAADMCLPQDRIPT